MRGSCRSYHCSPWATTTANLVESIRVDKPFDRNAALRAREAERRPMVKLLDLPATKGQADLKKFVQFQVGSVFIDNFMDQRLLPFGMRISQRQVRFTHLQPILSRGVCGARSQSKEFAAYQVRWKEAKASK